jgi:tetratricopeptide (TPR) repeat protein
MVKKKEFSLEEACKSTNYVANLREIVQTHSCESARNLGLAILSGFNDENEKAVELLELLVKKNPNISLLHQRIAEFCIDSNNYKKAVFHLEKVIELQKQDITARFWLCLIYHWQGNTEKAQTTFEYLKKFVYRLQVKIE